MKKIIPHFGKLAEGLFFITSVSALLSLFSEVHFFCALFEHFYWHYLLISFFLLVVFSVVRRWKYWGASLALGLFCGYKVMLITPSLILDQTGKNPPLSLYLHNILADNSKFHLLGDEVLKEKVDVVALVEFHSRMGHELDKKFFDYPYKFTQPEENHYLGFGIYSKYPLEEVHAQYFDGFPFFIEFYLNHPKIKKGLKIFLVHLFPPLWPEAWQLQKKALSAIQEKIKHERSPYLIMGDFNLTPWSNHYRAFFDKLQPQFYSGGLTFTGTWPAFLPPFLRIPIDHVFSNRPLTVEKRPARGSDHIGFRVEVDL